MAHAKFSPQPAGALGRVSHEGSAQRRVALDKTATAGSTSIIEVIDSKREISQQRQPQLPFTSPWIT
jgi:hypothetical protein